MSSVDVRDADVVALQTGEAGIVRWTAASNHSRLDVFCHNRGELGGALTVQLR